MKTLDETHWKQSLLRLTKQQLVHALIEMACGDRLFRRKIESRFDLAASPGDLIDSTRKAIAEATAYDPKHLNSNFDYDSEAYRIVQDNFVRLEDEGRLSNIMELSVELMVAGSAQIEASDEGMMLEEIEACLRVGIDAVEKSDLASSDVIHWCHQMTRSDRIGFICEAELNSLRRPVQP